MSVHTGRGNVYADLGLPNAEEHLAKAGLAHTLCELIAAAGITQQAAAERLGIDQPKVSALMRGKLQDFSTERLMRFVYTASGVLCVLSNTSIDAPCSTSSFAIPSSP